jgi:hypothetical protein
VFDPATAILIAILGGGFLTGLAVYRKATPEAESIAVTTSLQLVTALRSEMALREQEFNDRLREKDRQIATLQRRLNEVEGKVKTLEDNGS